MACMSELTKGTRSKKQQHANVLGKCEAKNNKKVKAQKIESDTKCNLQQIIRTNEIRVYVYMLARYVL